MKLVFVTPGDSVHTLPWVEEFSSAGHEVVVYAYPPVTMDYRPSCVREVIGGGPLARGRWLRSAVLQDEPDAVVMHYAGVDTGVLSRLPLPVVVSVWGSDILRDLRGRPLKRAIVERALRRADLVVSPALHMTRRLEASRVEAARILTVQYGVDTAGLDFDREQAEAPIRVLSTRSFAPVYRIGDLVDAAGMVDRSLVARVTLVGAGPLEEQLRAQVRECDAGDVVEFLGALSGDGIVRELRRADVYVSTSESDGASVSLLEAMASGLPCIVSDIPANREWIDEDCGVFFPVGDPGALATAIGRLAADPALRRAMGSCARRRVADRGDRRKNMNVIRCAVERVQGTR